MQFEDPNDPTSLHSFEHCASGFFRILGFCLLLGGYPVAACAQSSFDEDFDDVEKPWKEVSIQLPAAPIAEHLLSFYVSPTATQTFAIDPKSLSIGLDGVIRYTLVASSSAGAKSVSYEGIRCQSYEKKRYAFGQQDGSWSRARNSQWEPIMSSGANRQHASLAKDYFCQGLTNAGQAGQMLERIRNKRPLSP